MHSVFCGERMLGVGGMDGNVPLEGEDPREL